MLRLETLLSHGVKIVVITGTHFGNVNGQFCSKIRSALKVNLYVCVNRGSEVFGFSDLGREVVLHRRSATSEENRVMDEISREMVGLLEDRYNLHVEVVANRFNRRKLDLIPLPEWRDPPKEKIDLLLQAVTARLANHGVKGGIQELTDVVANRGREKGIPLCITTDVKHIEYGLTDKSDSVKYILERIARAANIRNEDILFLGDEFGPIGGFDGSDFRMYSQAARGAVYVSVGKEPNGVPEGVVYFGKGPEGFKEIIDMQIRLWQD
jgi:hydroxymethylpyrimidine pyrophosphatase-like HAD family hydrolase